MQSASMSMGSAGSLFRPHPNLGDDVNENICQSDVEGGVFLRDLEIGTVLAVKTRNHTYRLEKLGDGKARISGHPEFCPEPVVVRLHGCTWGKSMLRADFVGRGMYLEFRHPTHGVVCTSRILEVREEPAATLA